MGGPLLLGPMGQALPESKLADDSRANLNTLLLAIRKALDDPKAAYKPRQQVHRQDRVDRRCRSRTLAEPYHSHRRLMDALVRMIEDPKGGDQNTIKAKVEEFDAQQALLEHGYPGARAEGPTDAAPATSNGTEGPSKPGSLDDLYEGVQRTKTGLPDNFGKSTLMRDGLPERKQDATGDGPLYRPPAPSPSLK